MTPVDRSLALVVSLDELARKDSPLGRIDPRAKVLAALAFIVVVVSYRPTQLIEPLPLLVVLLSGIVLGDVPIRMIVWRLVLVSPFVLLVGIWNPVFQTEPLVRLGPVVLSAGWVSFIGVMERFVFAVSAVLILMATTGIDTVALALGRLGVPRALVTQLSLLHRYVFVLGDEVSSLLRAHGARAPTLRYPTWQTTRSLLGSFLIRSLERAERIHMAMECRGFVGEVPRSTKLSFGAKDAIFLGGVLGYCVLVRCVNVPGWLGALVTK